MRPVISGGNSLTAVLAGAITTLQPSYEVAYEEQTGQPKSSSGQLNSTTLVTMLTSTTPRKVKSITIFNSDSATIVVSVNHVIDGTALLLAKQTLAAGNTLIIDEDGVTVINGQGQTLGAIALTTPAPVALIPTSDGLTTGLIPAAVNGKMFISATSASANNLLSLPAAILGDIIEIAVLGATACKLISSVAADKCNNVVIGATQKAILTAGNFYRVEYVATNTWLLTGLTNLGAVQTAIVPS